MSHFIVPNRSIWHMHSAGISQRIHNHRSAPRLNRGPRTQPPTARSRGDSPIATLHNSHRAYTPIAQSPISQISPISNHPISPPNLHPTPISLIHRKKPLPSPHLGSTSSPHARATPGTRRARRAWRCTVGADGSQVAKRWLGPHLAAPAYSTFRCACPASSACCPCMSCFPGGVGEGGRGYGE